VGEMVVVVGGVRVATPVGQFPGQPFHHFSPLRKLGQDLTQQCPDGGWGPLQLPQIIPMIPISGSRRRSQGGRSGSLSQNVTATSWWVEPTPRNLLLQLMQLHPGPLPASSSSPIIIIMLPLLGRLVRLGVWDPIAWQNRPPLPVELGLLRRCLGGNGRPRWSRHP